MPPARAATTGARDRTTRARSAAAPRSATGARAPSTRRTRATARPVERWIPAGLRGRSASSSSTMGSSAASADESQLRVRHARRGEPPGLGEHVDALVVLEHADEEQRRARGQRRHRRLAEAAEVDERRETPPSARPPSSRTSSVVNSDSVRTPSASRRRSAEQVDDRRDEPAATASRRADRSRRQSPWRSSTTGASLLASRGRAARGDVVRSLDDHRVGLEVAQLARDAHRQREVEDEPVERARAHGLHEVEGVVARRFARQRAREHADVGDSLERVELLPSRLVQRQPIPGSPDEQDPQARHPHLSSESTTSARCAPRTPRVSRTTVPSPSRATNPS